MSAPAKDARLEIAVPCAMTAIAETQASVAAFAQSCGLAQDHIHKLELVVDEALSNILLHGFEEGDASAAIRCVAAAGDGRFALTFIDNAAPFDPLTEAPPPDLDAPLEDRRIGGLGVHLVKSIADDCRYRREDGLNVLEATWRLD